MRSDQIRRRLEQERDRLLRMLDHGNEGLDLEDEAGTEELSSVDQHPADMGSELLEREKNLSIVEDADSRLRDVEEAFSRLEDGTYGKCAACGEPIGEDRLTARPAARYCLGHQQEAEERAGSTEALPSETAPPG